MIKYRTGLYIRLSREDDGKIYESESIKNQRSLLMQYVKDNGLDVYDVYIDDGYSGTNFNRPGFKRLLNDIETSKINMVITKDMSRLGRDYIGTGELVEKYFPSHNIRFIAITDNIDTFLDDSNNDMAPFKAIMNDYYAKDISKKIRASLRAKMKEGKCVSGRVPYGYMKDPNDKNHLVINNEQALVVKEIFRLSLDGLSYYKIANLLTDRSIRTPASYYNFIWHSNTVWNSKTIYDILTNKVYMGDLVQNKRRKINYKVKKTIKNKPSDYIITYNTHEAIIDRKTFDLVQVRLPKNVGRPIKKECHLLDGLLYCGDCGGRISITPRRKKDNRCYTICNYYRTYIKDNRCTCHSNNYDKLEEYILDLIKGICIKRINLDMIVVRIMNELKKNNDGRNTNKLEDLVNSVNSKLDLLYMDRLNRRISYQQYERIKNKIEEELSNRKQGYVNYEQNNNIDCDSINRYVHKYLNLDNISREFIVSIVDKIELFEDKRIYITLSFL